ncbi:hypothetical protein ACOBQB_03040 [Streptomyces sp. G5(2025)]|uniref:hypothetical protein n=1 Tax=Streptomyces sp. G5(2025) TaxID=3406628 RepID=UPI003C14808B
MQSDIAYAEPDVAAVGASAPFPGAYRPLLQEARQDRVTAAQVWITAGRAPWVGTDA